MQSITTLSRRYATAAWRHRWVALAFAWLACLGGWAAVHAVPDQFRSSARLYADADAILGSLLRNIAVDASPAAQVEMLQRTLLSRPNIEKVIARTDLDLRVDSAASRERMVEKLGNQVRMVPQGRGQNLFKIEYSDRDPRVAQSVVQTVLTIFMEAATSNDRQQMNNARGFVARQLAVYEAQLRDAERRRAEFQARYVDLLPSDALGGATRLEAGRGRLLALRGELEDARMRRDLTRQQMEAVPAFLTATEAAVAAGGGGGNPRLADAERVLRELRVRYTEQHPDVVATRALIAELRTGGGGGGGRPHAAPRTGGGGGRVSNPLYEQLRIRLVDADAGVASLERQVRDQEAEVERLDGVARTIPDVVAQFTNLNRDYAVVRRQYEELLERREAVQVADAARTSADRVRLEVIDPPTFPIEPSSPNRPLLLSLVLAAGIGGGAALALLLARLDAAFYTPQDLRKLGLPVLGAISAPRGRRAFGSAAGFAAGLVLLLAGYGAVVAGVSDAVLKSVVSRMVA